MKRNKLIKTNNKENVSMTTHEHILNRLLDVENYAFLELDIAKMTLELSDNYYKTIHKSSLKTEKYKSMKLSKYMEKYVVEEDRQSNTDIIYDYIKRNDDHDKKTILCFRVLGSNKKIYDAKILILSILRDELGNATNLIAVAQDITELKQSERDMVVKNQLNDFALDITKSGVWSINLNNPEYYFGSERTCEIFGEEPREGYIYHNRKEWRDRVVAVSEKYAIEADVELEKAINGEDTVYEATYPYLRPADKRLVWIHAIGKIIRDSKGKATSLQAIIQDVTEKHNADAEIGKLAFAIEQNPNVVYITNTEDKIEYINSKFTELYGYSKDEVVGKTPSFLWTNYHEKEYYENLWETVKSGETWVGEIYSKTKQGAYVWESSKIAPVKNDSGKIKNYIVINEDITQQKADRERINNLVTSLEQNPNLVIITNPDGVITYVNNKIEEMTGYTKEEIIGKNASILNTKKFENISKKIFEVLSETGAFEGEIYNKRKDGTCFWSNTRVSPVYNEKNQLISFVSNKEDISQRKANEFLLQETKKKIDIAMDVAQLAYWEFDIETRTLILNDKYFSIIHNIWTDEEYENVTKLTDYTEKFVYSEDIEHVVTTINEIVKNDDDNDNTAIEYRLLTAEGNINYVSAKLVAFIRDDAGKALRFQVVTQVITEEKEAERLLKEAKTEAENATRAKSDFLANMSHEIRTPMNAVIGLTNLLGNTELNKKQRDYISKTQNAATNLLGILNDILDFSKIEAGKLNIENIEFNLDDVLDNTASLLSLKSFDKGVELILSKNFIQKNNLIGDPLRLGQIITNLANNSIKFTSEGEVQIKVEETSSTNESSTLLFSVIDTGIGMTTDQVNHLFKAFSQADTSTTRKYGGTGLGLTISKNLVEQMGGTINVESEYGKGSTFSFILTFKLGDEASSQKLIVPETISNLKALVVDDNVSSREVIKSYLHDFGIKADEAANGREAIEMIDETYAFVLLDWKMPDLNGNETWIKIKEKMKDKTPKVIMLTAYGKETVIDNANAIGINTVLMKPISQSNLFNSIMEIFGKDYESASTVRTSNKIKGLSNIYGAKILVVEDNEFNQLVIKETLEIEGFVVEIAENGKIAVDLFERNNNYDAILMDLQMPVMSGYEASEYLRSKGFTDIPIIALSADALMGVRERVIASGMNGYISKPIDLNELFSTLVRFIKPINNKKEQYDKVAKVANTKNVFEELHRFKVIESLERLLGNKNTYTLILKSYYKSYNSFCSSLLTYLVSNEMDTAAREVHSLKGVAGNVGATKTYELAIYIEKLIKSKADVISSEAFYDLCESMTQDMKDIKLFLNK